MNGARLLRWLLPAIAVIGIAAMIGTRLAEKHAAPAAPAAPAASAPAATPGAGGVIELLADDVTVATMRPLQRLLHVTGSLRPVAYATVKARSAGEVRELAVREGEAVRAGQLLGRIDTTELDLRVRAASDNVAAARGQVDIARKNRDNNRALFERGFISATSLQNAEAQLVTAQATMDANSAALDLARKALADAAVLAPIDGVVAARLVQPGERVTIDARLLDIVDIRQLELEASVPASEISQVRVGQTVQVQPEGQATALVGKVVRVNPTNLAGSRSYLVYVQLPNPEQRLRAGLFAEAAIVLEQRSAVLTLPATAVRQGAAGPTVLAIEDGKLVEHAVATGQTSDDAGGSIEIRAGLGAGAQVVRRDLGALRAGSRVSIGAARSASPTRTPPSAASPRP